NARLLVSAGERLARVLLFAVLETEHERVVAVLLLRALRHDDRTSLDDGAGHDRPVLGENLGHADLATDDSGMLIHDSVDLCAPPFSLASTLRRWRSEAP